MGIDDLSTAFNSPLRCSSIDFAFTLKLFQKLKGCEKKTKKLRNEVQELKTEKDAVTEELEQLKIMIAKDNKRPHS